MLPFSANNHNDNIFSFSYRYKFRFDKFAIEFFSTLSPGYYLILRQFIEWKPGIFKNEILYVFFGKTIVCQPFSMLGT